MIQTNRLKANGIKLSVDEREALECGGTPNKCVCARIFIVMNKRNEFDAEKFFLALSDRTRLRLINLMRDDEVCVCFFTEVLQAPQPTISRHLAYLRQAGMVSARREGKWMHYRIVEPADEHAARIFKEICAWLREQPEMRRDRERLVRVCCSPGIPIALRGAPRPPSLVNIEKRAVTSE